MPIWRPGVGRIATANDLRHREVRHGQADPHPGYDGSGINIDGRIAEVVKLPGGMVIEHRGRPQGADEPPAPEGAPMPSPADLPVIPASPPRDWRKDYGLNRNG